MAQPVGTNRINNQPFETGKPQPKNVSMGYYNGAFDYSATPLGPLGCKIMIHNTSNKRKYWNQRGREGFSVGIALQHVDVGLC